MISQIEEAYERIKANINKTPIMTSSTLDNLLKCKCFFKCENFQKTGAFKFRGALNTLLMLSKEEKSRGVITHSSGNHAQALALAAKIVGIKVVIVMPENASPIKVQATRSYGAEIIFCGIKPGDREIAVIPLIKKYGYVLIHPSDDLRIIQGAGTAAYELIKEVKKLDYLFCPVGGGGLVSGSAITVKGLLPKAKVIAVEPKNANDAYHSFKERRIVPSINPVTIADGLKTQLGKNTFKIILENVDDIITVSEEEIVDAMQFLWERMKLIIEPSGAVPLAGILSKQVAIENKQVGAILSGGNIALTEFFDSIRKKIHSSM